MYTHHDHVLQQLAGGQVARLRADGAQGSATRPDRTGRQHRRSLLGLRRRGTATRVPPACPTAA